MKYLKPNYDESIVSVSNSILKYFNAGCKHNSLKYLDDYISQSKPKNIVLVLFDGLGYNILRRNKDICPVLNKYLKQSVSSVFPTTTMAARTSIESGLNPVEHGWMGWDMYFKDFNEVITLTRNVIKGTNKKPADYHVAKTLLKYESVIDKINKKDNCYAKKLSVYSNHPNESLDKLIRKIKKITKRKEKTYTYIYYNEPDHVMHKTGTCSNETRKYLIKIDKWFRKLCSKLKDTLVIAIADHGHINTTHIKLNEHPNIMKMLDGDISIDNRACSFRVKKEYKKEFLYKLKKLLKDDFVYYTKDEVIKEKLYGSGIENKYFRDGLGDYLAVGINNVSLRQDDKSSLNASSHSGLTEDEMLVPLIICSKGK